MSERAILCVDDERIILTSLRTQLRRRLDLDVHIETAETGEEGLEVLDELAEEGIEVPVVISDQMMPGMRGEAFLAEVHQRLPSTLSILLTGQATAEAVGKAVNTAQLYRFIGKPWTEDDLVMTVREAVRSYDQAAAIRRRDDELRRTHEATLRFVPREFLALLGREYLVDVQFGDSVERPMHVLFADLRGYTTLVEGKSASESFAFINAFVQRLDTAIRAHGGFISNIEGDAILALFSEGADAALQAGLAAHRSLVAWNAERAPRGEAPVRMGVGLNSGSLLLGTVGASDRLQCDVVGDAVNVCARIESLTKLYQTELLLSGDLQSQLAEPGDLRPIDRCWVKGKSRACSLYEAIDALDPPRAEARRATRDRFATARRAFAAGQLAEAREGFRQVLDLDPTDGAARVHIERCDTLERTGLPDGWDGTVRMRRK